MVVNVITLTLYKIGVWNAVCFCSHRQHRLKCEETILYSDGQLRVAYCWDLFTCWSCEKGDIRASAFLMTTVELMSCDLTITSSPSHPFSPPSSSSCSPSPLLPLLHRLPPRLKLQETLLCSDTANRIRRGRSARTRTKLCSTYLLVNSVASITCYLDHQQTNMLNLHSGI